MIGASGRAAGPTRYQMNKSNQFILFISILFFSGACSPEPEPTTEWFKGNLHTHTYWSDGDDFPERVMDWYKSEGYNFLALSEHNIVADVEKWVDIRPDEVYQNAFAEYLSQFGEEWVTHKKSGDTTQVLLKTFQEYAPRFEEKGEFLMIPAEEITDRFEEAPIHLNATNIQELIQPQGGNSILDVLQNNVDAVIAQRDSTGEPIMVHVNHPNFFYGVTLDDLIKLEGERFFELYNGHHMVNNLGDSLHVSTEDMWDRINTAYLAMGKPLMYGLATDDSHNYHAKGKEWSNSGRGWVMVAADSLDTRALIESMEEGNFYSSTGVELNRLSVEENKIHIEVNAELGVNYEISFIGLKVGANETVLIETVDASSAEFTISNDWLFVRSKIVSDKVHGQAVVNGELEVAWTQPIRHQEIKSGVQN